MSVVTHAPWSAGRSCADSQYDESQGRVAPRYMR